MDKPVRIRGVHSSVQEMAKTLRRQMTPAEKILWNALRSARFERWKARRQHPLGRFILDFCIPSHKLVIEADGSIHDQQQEQDAVRTRMLEAYGYRVLRFKNDEIERNLEAVLKSIEEALRE